MSTPKARRSRMEREPAKPDEKVGIFCLLVVFTALLWLVIAAIVGVF